MADNDKYTPEELAQFEAQKTNALLSADENLKKFVEKTQQSKTSLKNLDSEILQAKQKTKEAFKTFGEGLAAGASGATQFNGLIDSGTGLLSSWSKKIPKVGKAVAGAVKVGGMAAQEVTKQADILSKSYKSISQSGVTGADGMRGAFESIQDFGYTLNEVGDYQKLVEKNSEVAAKFGGTAAQGVKKLATVSKDIQRDNVGGNLLKMGLTIDDINEGVANYVKTQTVTGRSQQQIDENITKSAIEYVYYQNKMSKITGQSVATLQKARDDALKEQQYGALIRNLQNSQDENSRNKAKALQEINENLQHIAPDMAKGLRDLAAGGKMSEEARRVLMLMPKTAKAITAGVVSVNEVMDNAVQESKASSQMVDSLSQFGVGTKSFIDGYQIAQVAALDTYEKRVEAAKKGQKVLDKTTNNIINTEIAQRNTTQQAEKLISAGLDPAISGLSKVADAGSALAAAGGKMIGVKPAGGAPAIGGGGGTFQSAPSAKAVSGATAGATFGGGAVPSVKPGSEGSGATPPPAKTGGFFSSLFGGKKEGETAPTAKPTGKNAISEILNTGPGWLEVKRPDGKVERLEGARNWRNNNPGNIEYGDYAKSMGAIGSDGRFAIFPDYETGRKAKAGLIFEGKNYSSLPLTDAITRYAPPSENNTQMYQRAVLAAVDNQNKVMQTYASGERDNIMDAMERVEGFKVGTIKPATVTAANGGIASGPKSGYSATLHGTEAIVPLPNGNSIPVDMPQQSFNTERRTKLLGQQLEMFSGMLSIQKKQVSVTNKILQLQS